MNDEIKVKAFAKLNLTMEVLSKRDDGYHNVRTLMQFISLYDELIFKESENIVFECNDKSIENDKNLVVRAFKLIQSYMNERGVAIPNMYIYLDKRVPYMSGMGSGSSDAAMVLYTINKKYNCGLSQEELCRLGKALGADVPACLYGNTLIAEGIGEKIEVLETDNEYHYVIIKPNEAFSTAQMYKKIDEQSIYSDANYTEKLREQIINQDKLSFYNNFEMVAVPQDIVKKYKDILVDVGAYASSMTGAGSAFFGIFKDEKSAILAQTKLDELNVDSLYSTYCCHSLKDMMKKAMND